MSAEELDEDNQQDIFYIAEAELAKIKAKIKDGKEVERDEVNAMTFPEDLEDEAIMVPVDMRGVGEEFDDVEQMVEKLGPKGAAEAFIKAREYFEANKDGEPEDQRPKPMTALEWKKVLEEEDIAAEGLEEELMEGEEEELFEGEEEELLEGDDEVEEPPAKKAKTD